MNEEDDHLARETKKIELQLNSLSADEKKKAIEKLTAGLTVEGIALSQADRTLLEKFEKNECTFEDLTAHFRNRILGLKNSPLN